MRGQNSFPDANVDVGGPAELTHGISFRPETSGPVQPTSQPETIEQLAFHAFSEKDNVIHIVK